MEAKRIRSWYMRDGYTLPAQNLCHTSHIRNHAEAGGGEGGEECKAFLGETFRRREKVGRERETDGKKAGKERRTVKRQGKRDGR
jgi:hypothetical protein